jgi:hypothetical protein
MPWWAKERHNRSSTGIVVSRKVMENMWTREIFWNVGGDKKVVVYCLAAIAVGVLLYGIYR